MLHKLLHTLVSKRLTPNNNVQISLETWVKVAITINFTNTTTFKNWL